jgi:hypothetical protein
MVFWLQSGDKRADKAQQERLRNNFNLGVADCPVFANIFKYCQVRLGGSWVSNCRGG